MAGTPRPLRIAVIVLRWTLTAVVALGVGIAGVTKLHEPNHWQPLFLAWGYPAWGSMTTGVVEVVGVIALCIPRTATYAAGVLAVVMAIALATLRMHPDGKLGNGATPALYIALLAGIVFIRWRTRTRPVTP
jgi:uncharacterized membrane protein YphA (DoxX/SURF4 family)